ncbi:MAG: hypothetical protein AB7L66_06865 [Gemmatimonadales bacterium]
MASPIPIYLEIGAKRTFAAAVEWPGWCRSGPTEDAAVAALVAHGSPYAAILTGTRLGFRAPTQPNALRVVERLPGTPMTDFGAITVPPAVDHDRDCDEPTLRRLEKIARAAWQAFDTAVEEAQGHRLATGPRGGGRSLGAIVAHVLGADEGHLSAVGWKGPSAGPASRRLERMRAAIIEALYAAGTGVLPGRGPRGGTRWTARWFARRVVWHTTTHTWEIERRRGDQSR